MFPQANVIYLWDGTLEGLLCCVFESFTRHRQPLDIWDAEAPQTSLVPQQDIPTHRDQAGRVWRGLCRISPEAVSWVEHGFLSGEPDRPMALFLFCLAVFQRGSSVTSLLADPVVNRVFQLVRSVQHEAHLLTGFVRFGEHDGVLAAEISPKAFVLPLLAPHFAQRYPGEAFLIHDQTHHAVLLHQAGRLEILPLDALSLSDPTPQEQEFQRLWKQYYHTIAIQERLNPRCRMSHCPKRYWQHMLELSTSAPTSAPWDPASPAAAPPPDSAPPSPSSPPFPTVRTALPRGF